MYQTNYQRAGSLEEAKAALTGEAKLLAGGQTLIPTMKQRLAAPDRLIDIGRLEALKGIAVMSDAVTIGAGETHAQVAGNDEVATAIPALAALAGEIGDAHVRHMGTLGGSLANNDPAADYPAAVLGLNATIHTTDRQIDADSFFTGLFETALREDEIITRVVFEVPARAGYGKFPNPASRYAMCGVFVARMRDGGVRVAITGVGDDGVYRDAGLEQALAQDWSAAAVDGVTDSAAGKLSDIHASAEYRAHLVKVMAKLALERAG